MEIGVIGEGLTDYKVLKNLLVGFSGNKNLDVSRLLPENTEPVGWSNVIKYLDTEKFRNAFDFIDYIIIQIDTDTCQEWNLPVSKQKFEPGDIPGFVQQIKDSLIHLIDPEFYQKNAHKIIFAIAVHQIECWVLPFVSDKPSDSNKITGCTGALESIANRKGYSIDQKNYGDGKYYDDLSKGMKNRKDLMRISKSNISLGLFIKDLELGFNFGEMV